MAERDRLFITGSMSLDQSSFLADPMFHDVLPPEKSRTSLIAEELGKSVFGQADACRNGAEMITNAHSGFHDGKRPLGSAIFLGPTGVGKTELGRAMARFLFPDDPEGHTIVIDGTSLPEASAVTRLKGSDPKYVGFGGSVLIMPDKVKDGAVIITDEIEKAHPEVWKWFMPLLDVGKTTLFLTNGKKSKTGTDGMEVEPVDLSVHNCFLIFTSNEGASEMQDARVRGGSAQLGFRTTQTPEATNNYQDIAMNALKKGQFRKYPEFLGRIDRFVVFRDLYAEHYGQVFDKFFFEAGQHQMRNDPNGYVPIMITTELKQWIIQQANVIEFGAREIRSTLHRLLLQPFIDYKVSDMFSPRQLVVGYVTPEGELRFRQQVSSPHNEIVALTKQPELVRDKSLVQVSAASVEGT